MTKNLIDYQKNYRFSNYKINKILISFKFMLKKNKKYNNN